MRDKLTILLSALLLLAASTLGVNAASVSGPPDKCTGVYVGKEVSAEGTTIIARSEDQARGAYNKLFFVQPASDKSGGVITDSGEGQEGFSVEIPDKTLKYTYLQDASDLADGPYYACCMNELGVAVIGTVTTEVSDEYAAIDPLKPMGKGIRESIEPAVVACQATSAEDAVNVLASYIKRYGSSEYSTLFFSDREEAWIMEIYGGSTYAAMRLPEDKMAVIGNQIMMGWVDPDGADGYIVAPGLKDCLSKLQDPVKKGDKYHLARSIAPSPRREYCNMRSWRGYQLFAPSSIGDYSDDDFYPLLFKPERKVSLMDVMQLYGDRYEGTEYDMSLPGNEDRRPIGTTRQSDVHIIQTFEDMPANCCQLQWLSMGNAEHAIFVPAFSGITDTYEKYKVDDDETGAVNDSFYYLCRSICSITESDREFLSKGVKDFNLAQEQKMQEEVTAAIPDIEAAYDSSDKKGDAFVTDLAMRMAEEQYHNAEELYRHVLFTQMDNLNDTTDKEYKTEFKMPEVKAEQESDADAGTEDGKTVSRGMLLIAGLLSIMIVLVAIDIVIRRNKDKE